MRETDTEKINEMLTVNIQDLKNEMDCLKTENEKIKSQLSDSNKNYDYQKKLVDQNVEVMIKSIKVSREIECKCYQLEGKVAELK